MHDELGLAEAFPAQTVPSRQIRSCRYHYGVHNRDFLSNSLAFERAVFAGGLLSFYLDFPANDMEV